jgi:nucleoid-associated protein YgaU
MRVDLTSRYGRVIRIVDDTPDGDGTIRLATREPTFFVDDSENSMYIVKLGDTLESIAAERLEGYPNAAQLYWIIGEFQTTPILDPTLQLKPGSILIIPSYAVVNEMLYSILEDTII